MGAIEDLEEQLRWNPYDWPSWLVYADWLLEQGDEHGRLIGLERERWTAPDDERRAALTDEIKALEDQYRPVWLQGLPDSYHLSWNHGFVRRIHLHSHNPVDLPRLLALPVARFLAEISVWGTVEPLLALFERHAIVRERIRSLEFRGRHAPSGDEPVLALASSEAMGGIERLQFDRRCIGPKGAAALAGSPTLRNLVSLDLSNNAIGSEGAIALARSPTLRLTSLSLHSTGLGLQGAEALTSSPSLAKLARLDLSNNRLGPSVAHVVARSEALQSLTDLNLARNRLTDAGAAELAGAERLRGLTGLELESNAISDAGAFALAGSAELRSLALLSLPHNRVGPAGALALARSVTLPLTRLDLQDNPIGEEAAAALWALRDRISVGMNRAVCERLGG